MAGITLLVELQHRISRHVAVYFSIVLRKECWASFVSLSTSVNTTTVKQYKQQCDIHLIFLVKLTYCTLKNSTIHCKSLLNTKYLLTKHKGWTGKYVSVQPALTQSTSILSHDLWQLKQFCIEKFATIVKFTIRMFTFITHFEENNSIQQNCFCY